MRELKSHRIKREIKTLQDELEQHQSKCKHPNATKKYGANTGNYDPSSDCYWTDFSCPTCLKMWRVGGSV